MQVMAKGSSSAALTRQANSAKIIPCGPGAGDHVDGEPAGASLRETREGQSVGDQRQPVACRQRLVLSVKRGPGAGGFRSSHAFAWHRPGSPRRRSRSRYAERHERHSPTAALPNQENSQHAARGRSRPSTHDELIDGEHAGLAKTLAHFAAGMGNLRTILRHLLPSSSSTSTAIYCLTI